MALTFSSWKGATGQAWPYMVPTVADHMSSLHLPSRPTSLLQKPGQLLPRPSCTAKSSFCVQTFPRLCIDDSPTGAAPKSYKASWLCLTTLNRCLISSPFHLCRARKVAWAGAGSRHRSMGTATAQPAMHETLQVSDVLSLFVLGSFSFENPEMWIFLRALLFFRHWKWIHIFYKHSSSQTKPFYGPHSKWLQAIDGLTLSLQ